MPRYVALLRGVNVGPKKRIRMDDLRGLVEGIGHTGVQTYVNSGNVVFSCPQPQDNVTLAAQIEEALSARHGLDVRVVARSGEELAGIVANNPFPDIAATPKLLHVSFLGDTPDAALVAALAGVKKGDDDYRVVGQDVYLHYPNGISGAVFMVNGFDKALQATSTSRNWRTVVKLAEMAAK